MAPVLNSIADVEAAEEVWAPDMPGRVTYLTDPVLGGGQQAAGTGPDGQLAGDNSGTAEPLPVVLFEPTHAAVIENIVTGLMQEARTDGMIANGFHRIPGGPVQIIQPARGWELRRLPGELVLLDSTGDIWARSKITPDPAWVSAAASYRNVVVFCGPQLGIRTPHGIPPARYGTARRAAEFRQGRRQGLVVAATVTWNGQAGDEILDWTTLLPGSFLQPLPAILAPLTNFTRHGGPGALGLTCLGDHDMAIPSGAITTMVARVSRTDIDLLDPAEAAPYNWLGGVHYGTGVHPEWRKTALSYGRVLLLTGRSLPSEAPSDPLTAREINGNL